MRQAVEEMAGIALVGKADGADEGDDQYQQADAGIEAAACHHPAPGVADVLGALGGALHLWLSIGNRHECPALVIGKGRPSPAAPQSG